MKKHIYLMGGIGNVMYQINLAYFLLRLGYKVNLNSVLIEKNWITILKKWKVHDGTVRDIRSFIDSKLTLINRPSIFLIFGLNKNKFLGRLSGAYNFGHDFPSEIEAKRFNHFFGYFQKTQIILPNMNENFSNNCTVILRPEILAEIRNVENVVLHYRSGDKKMNKAFGTDFTKLLSKICFSKLIIVTDSKNEKEIHDSFHVYNYTVRSGANALEDFRIIQLAKNKVLSRSSFSWWAAEFSEQNSTIIQPYPFYTHVDWVEYSNVSRKKYGA